MVESSSLHHRSSSTSVHHSLLQSLQKLNTPSDRHFTLTTLRSKPFRTHALYPHASDPNQPIHRSDYLILLAERFHHYLSSDQPPPSISVPVFALEASIYTIPSTATAILYISKLDSTGLSPFAAPATALTEAFISHFFAHPPRSIEHLRVHIFARAAREGQYLFPGSASNVSNGNGDGSPLKSTSTKTINSNALPPRGKRVLDDQQLIKWWKTVLSKPLAVAHRFYILPGFDQEESLAILNDHLPGWRYGHPYHVISSPLKLPVGMPLTLADLIPALSDDPKARFLQSLSQSVAAPAGEAGDWDDSIYERAPAGIEADRVRERRCLNVTSVDEFWERMGGRQECCDGRVSAFFVLAGPTCGTGGSEETGSVSSLGAESTHHKLALVSSSLASNHSSSTVSRNVWVKLWSKVHTRSPASLSSSPSAFKDWHTHTRA